MMVVLPGYFLIGRSCYASLFFAAFPGKGMRGTRPERRKAHRSRRRSAAPLRFFLITHPAATHTRGAGGFSLLPGDVL